MNTNVRKIAILIFSLAFVLAAFWMYISATGIADFAIDQHDPNLPVIDDPCDENAGKIDETTYLHVLEKAVFPHYDLQGRIDRRLGFEKVLAVVADQWEIEKPYIDILKENFKCYVTADKGSVRRQDTQTASPSAKDASFSGNVVIKFQTSSDSDPNDNIIYLDDIIFVSDKNLFFTTGPIKVVSKRAFLQGRGLELIYNEDTARLEFLKIIHLDKLVIKDISDKPSDQENQIVITDNKSTQNAVEPEPASVSTPADTNEISDPKPVTHYQLALRKNVVIDAPQQLIFADNLFIHNIAGSDSPEKTENTINQPSVTEKQTSFADDTGIPQKQTILVAEPNSQQQEIIVTCDDGLIVKPVESPMAYDGSVKISLSPPKKATLTPDSNDTSKRQKLITGNIDYYHDTEDIIASGKSKITFYASQNPDVPGDKFIPVDVTFSDKATFTPDANQVILHGNCLCLMKTQDGSMVEENRLSSDKLIIDLEKRNDSSDSQAQDMKNLTAQGGIVRLSTVKKIDGHTIKATELKSKKIVYNMPQKMFQATGPGDIKIDNSKVEIAPDSNDSAFNEKYFAIITDFDTLTYFEDSNQLVAKSSEDKNLNIQYFPVNQAGQFGQTINISAKHITADIARNSEGRNQISDLTASGDIIYKDDEKQFDGSKLVLDSKTEILTIYGDENYPCRINGTPTGTITYNLKTETFKGEILAPGIFNIPQK